MTAPLLDAAGQEVPVPDGAQVTEAIRLFFAGRLPAPECDHYMYASEIRQGLKVCESCELRRTR